MTILRQTNLSDNVVAQLFEAPYHNSNSEQRQRWVYEGRSFFNLKINDLWELYVAPLTHEIGSDLPECVLQEERRTFLRRNPLVCFDKISHRTIGGLWVGEKRTQRNWNIGVIHIKFGEGMRNYAHSFLPFAENILSEDFNVLECDWGPRNSEDDPNEFFRSQGYEVVPNPNGCRAYKILKEVRDINLK